MSTQEFTGWVNVVSIIGRVTSEAEFRELPSGETLAKFRVVIPRRSPQTKTTVDTIDCVAFKSTIQRKAQALGVGQVVEISGALRRQFWKTGAGVASRVEVEVTNLKALKI